MLVNVGVVSLTSIRHILYHFFLTNVGKAMGYTAGGLVAGSIIGGLIQAGIRIDEHPIGVRTYHSVLKAYCGFISCQQTTERNRNIFCTR